MTKTLTTARRAFWSTAALVLAATVGLAGCATATAGLDAGESRKAERKLADNP